MTSCRTKSAAEACRKRLRALTIPEELRGGWRVEDDFVAAILGERPVTHTSFATGVRYMQFTEAVARSSRHQVPVTFPSMSSPTPVYDRP